MEVLQGAAAAFGMDLESARIGAAGRHRVLRVVVDADGGVNLDSIAEISRDLSARLDAAGVMGKAPYTLEVSSPGVDRPLTQQRHWRRALGRLVKVTLPGPAVLTGRVVAANGHGVTLEVGAERREFGYTELGPGRVQVEFGGQEPPVDLGAPDGH